MMQYQSTLDLWLARAVEDPDLTAELEAVRSDPDGVTDRFYRDLAFGTGGLRGVIGAAGRSGLSLGLFVEQVLQGHIVLLLVVGPRGARDCYVNAKARSPMMQGAERGPSAFLCGSILTPECRAVKYAQFCGIVTGR